MGVRAEIFDADGHVTISLRSETSWQERVAADPAPWVEEAPLLFTWDADARERGEWTLISLHVFDIAALDEQMLAALDALPLPLIDCPELAITDSSISSVLRRARQRYPAHAGGDWRDEWRSADAPRTCPRCNSVQVAPILRGMPTMDAFLAAEKGLIELGGCVIDADDPTWRCRACGHAGGHTKSGRI